MSTVDELKAAVEAAQAQLLAAGKKGDLDAMRTAMVAVTAAEANVKRAVAEEERAANAALQAQRMEASKGAREALLGFISSNPDPFNASVAAGLKSFWVRCGDDGSWQVDVSAKVAATTTAKTPKEPKAAGEGGVTKGRHMIAPSSDPGVTLTSRQFLEGLAESGNQVAIDALARIEAAKAEGKPSPGFDSAVKRLVGEGYGAFV